MPASAHDPSALLPLLLDHAPVAVALFDRDMRYLAVTRRFCTDYALDERELVGRSHYEVFPDLPERWKEAHRRALAGEVVRCDADRHDIPGRGGRWQRWEVRPWPDHTGQVGGILLFAEDLTELRQTEQTLGQERDLNVAITQTARMAIVLLDPDGRVRQLNPFLEHLSGWLQAEVVGHDWFETFLPARDRERVRAVFRRAVGGEQTRGFINPIVTRGGEEREIEWFDVRMTGADGRFLGLLALGLDVTDRKRAEGIIHDREERLRAIMDTATDAIVTIDERGTVLSVNPATSRLFGYAADELVGRNVSVLMPPPYRDEHDGYIARYLATGEKRIIGVGREMVGCRKDGTVFPIDLNVSEVDHERVFTGIIRDLTNRKELEARLLRAQRLESIGTLVSGIAHDLNNVLTPVLMAVKLLKKDRPGLDKADLLDTAQRSVERGADMIRQLLAFGGKLDGEQVLVHLTPLAVEVIRLLEHTLPKSIAIRREWADGPDAVTGDPTQLTQVLMNLCVNARDAMPDGGTLTLSLESSTLDARSVALHPGAKVGRYLLLSVADTGTGIPADVQDKMFDPFFTTKPQGQGTGLGLSTVAGIVRGHGGFVTVYSEVGRGTKFSVYLPAAEPAGKGGSDVSRWHPNGRGEAILVVDDEPAILAAARSTLDGHGYHTLTADGGAEGIAVFRAHRDTLRLVVVDLMMPGTDGPAVMAVVRSESPDLPILAASGLPPTGRYAEAITAASARFISKPYSDDDLLAAVRRSLAGR